MWTAKSSSVTAENELRFAQKDVSLCKPLVIITEEDIAMDEEMSDDEENDSEGR